MAMCCSRCSCQTRVSFILITIFLSLKIFLTSEAGMPTMLKLDSGSKMDLFLIGGKNCNTPTIIRQARKGVFGKRAKLVFIEPECKPGKGKYTSSESKLVPLLVKTKSS